MSEKFNLCSSGIEDTAKVQAELDNNTKRLGKERGGERESNALEGIHMKGACQHVYKCDQLPSLNSHQGD